MNNPEQGFTQLPVAKVFQNAKFLDQLRLVSSEEHIPQVAYLIGVAPPTHGRAGL